MWKNDIRVLVKDIDRSASLQKKPITRKVDYPESHAKKAIIRKGFQIHQREKCGRGATLMKF